MLPKSFFKSICISLFIFSFFLFKPAFADTDYQTTYTTDYFIEDTSARVEMNIVISNLIPDIYIKEYGLIFPASFPLEDIQATSGNQAVQTTIEKDDKDLKVVLHFDQPQVRSDETHFTLHFKQKNLVKPKGDIIEVVLPTVEDTKNTTFNIGLHLPAGFDKKIGIAKPLPTAVHGSDITWQNIQTRTVYVLFGSTQQYNLDLGYHLYNKENHPVYVDIALPPETQYQSITVESLKPSPTLTYLDQDGNYLARYNLLVGQKVNVQFKGTAQLFTAPQTDMYPYVKKNFEQTNKNLLSVQKYWDLGTHANDKVFDTLDSPEKIYSYVAKTLTYNYGRLSSNIKRLGAETIISKPDQAVCMEFTDLFVALAREKGYFSREIEGYGYSEDQTLRPLSLMVDVLHSWPEYYDPETHRWIRIDPTWENTSGIDYFHSFDLNHIVFAIHGTNSSTPYPAGTYKATNSKDVTITLSQSSIKKDLKLSFDDNLPSTIREGQAYKKKISFKNTGNVYVKNETITLESSNLDISPKKLEVELLPPGAQATFEITYSLKKAADQNSHKNAELKITSSHVKATHSFQVIQNILLMSAIIGGILLLLAIGVGLYLALHKKEHYDI